MNEDQLVADFMALPISPTEPELRLLGLAPLKLEGEPYMVWDGGKEAWGLDYIAGVKHRIRMPEYDR